MPKGTVSIDVRASPRAVFDVLHDYSIRLRWDTMLSEARLLGGATKADKGVRSLCVGTWRSAFIPMETEYVTFAPGEVAAVRLTNHPPLFERFAASIRHAALTPSARDTADSRVTYTYSFHARPRFLAWIIEPIISRLLAREVRARLTALRDFVESRVASAA